MNQSIIINDDYVFNYDKYYWQCTAIISAEKRTIIIYSHILPNQLTQTVKLDWEYLIEEQLEDQELTAPVIEVTMN